MATDFIYLKGKTKFFRHITPDLQYHKWSHVLYLEGEDLEKIRELQLAKDGVGGIKNHLKKDEDGYNMSFSRPTQKPMAGQVVAFQPPMVIDKDGVPFNGNVGHGSDVTTKLAVYTHKTPGGGKARATRWESSRIDNLVPFETKKDFTEQETAAARGLGEQPAQPGF